MVYVRKKLYIKIGKFSFFKLLPQFRSLYSNFLSHTHFILEVIFLNYKMFEQSKMIKFVLRLIAIDETK